jgi:hypothetical protein
VDNDDPKKTRAYKKQNTENEPANPDDVGQALKTLASQLGAFLDEIKADRTTDASERRTDRKWQRIIALAGTLIAFFTLLVLIETYSVYDKILATEKTQATIMGTQASIQDKQREISDQQAASLKRQLDDFETAEAANLAVTIDLTHRVDGQYFIYSGTMTIRNAGPTVAKDINWQVGGGPEPNGSIKPFPADTGIALAPNETLVPPVSDQQPAAAISSHDAIAAVKVTASYRDVFGKPAVVSACRWWNVDADEFQACVDYHDDYRKK